MNRSASSFVALLVVGFLANGSRAQAEEPPTVVLDPSVAARDVSVRDARIAYDASGDLDVVSLRDARFSRLGPGGFDLGYPKRPLVIRLRVSNPSSIGREWFLHAAGPFVDDLRFAIDRNPPMDPLVAGDSVPFDARVMPSIFPSFPFRLGPRETRDLYLRIASESQVRIPMRIERFDAHLEGQIRLAAIATGIAGFFLAILLFNAYYAAISRIASFAYLMLHYAAWLAFLLAQLGIAQRLLFPHRAGWNNDLSLLSGLAIPATLAPFLREQLGTRVRSPRLDRVLVALGLVSIGVYALRPFVPYRMLAPLGLVVLFSLPFVVAPAVVRERRHRGGRLRLFEAGLVLQMVSVGVWAALMLAVRGLSLAVSLVAGFVPYLLAGCTGVLFSFGLFERLRELEVERTRLSASEQRLARLAARASDVLVDVSNWARDIVPDLREALGGVSIELHERTDEGRASPLLGDSTDTPLFSSIAERAPFAGERRHVVRGADGSPIGLVSLQGGSLATLDDEGERLVRGFFQHVEVALEVRRAQRRVRQAERARSEAREHLRARGVALLRTCVRCGRCYSDEVEACETDGVPLLDEGMLPYRPRARYRLVRKIGEGGMGLVLEAFDEELGRRVAVKLVHPEYLAEPSLRARFELEGRALAKLDHPNVVRILDAGQAEGGALFLVMELVRGTSLSGMLHHHGAGRPEQVARFVRQAGSALAAVHREGLVHRDLKPANFLLVPSDGAFDTKLIDFGVVRLRDGGGALTSTGMIVGTPRYMAPEQVLGGVASRSSDVFSFALVAFEIVVGRPLLEGSDVAAVLQAAARPIEVSRLALVPDTTHRELLRRALARDPAERPDDISAWTEAFATAAEASIAAAPGWEHEESRSVEHDLDRTEATTDR